VLDGAEIDDEICEGDKVVARVTMHGHHVGEFLSPRPARSSRPSTSTSGA
jgi:predicted ester cyclase